MTTALPMPSKGGRWANCPASVAMEELHPEKSSDDSADEGRAVHWIAAQILGDHFEPEELVDRQADNGVVITVDMMNHAVLYVDAIRAVTDQPVVIEQPLPAIPGVKQGVTDARFVFNNWGFIFDLKYGYSIVEVVGNWQMIIYAVSMMLKHEWKLDGIGVTIVQPRPSHPEGKVRAWTITRDQLINFYHEIVAKAEATRDPNAACVTGPWCKHCYALHACEAAREAGCNAVDVTTAPARSREINGQDLSDELKALRRASEMITLRLDALESHATGIINNGGIVPGFMMQTNTGNRRWNVDVAVIEAMTGMTLTEPKPITPAAAERAGMSEAMLELYASRSETGRKLVERDSSALAAKVFGDG